MGDPANPTSRTPSTGPCSYLEHVRAVGLDRVVLVGHDWGGALAFDLGPTAHPRTVLACLWKAVSSRWAGTKCRRRGANRKISGAEGEELLSRPDMLVRQGVTGGVAHSRQRTGPAVYLAPYPTSESDGRSGDGPGRYRSAVNQPGLVPDRGIRAWLAAARKYPKVLMTFEGVATLLITGDEDWCASQHRSQEIAHCGRMGHHAPETVPTRSQPPARLGRTSGPALSRVPGRDRAGCPRTPGAGSYSRGEQCPAGLRRPR